MNFSRNKIRADEELSSEKLRSAREEKGLKIEVISEKIGISQEYLKIIESGEYSRLPGGVYQRTFIKKYASFLDLDPKKIEDAYFKETGFKQQSAENVFSRKVIKKRALLVFPKILRAVLATVIAIAIFLYLGVYLRNSLSKPNIEIFEPIDNLITDKKSIFVSGKADSKIQIEINDKLILKNDDGSFRQLIELKKGINTITISAKNKYSQKRIIKKQVLVK